MKWDNKHDKYYMQNGKKTVQSTEHILHIVSGCYHQITLWQIMSQQKLLYQSYKKGCSRLDVGLFLQIINVCKGCSTSDISIIDFSQV